MIIKKLMRNLLRNISGLWVCMQINEFVNTYTPDEIEAFMDFGWSFFECNI